MRQFLILLALFSLSHIAAAADVRLGTEVPFGTPVMEPAAGGQRIVAVATNGRGSLALWTDDRTSSIAIPNPAPGPAALWAGPVDPTGDSPQPLTHKLFDHATGTLVFTGTTYLAIVTPQDATTFFQPLSNDGYPVGPSIAVPVAGPAVSAASNGRNIALLHTRSTSGVVLSLFNFDGTLIASKLLLTIYDAPQIFLFPNGDYGVVATHYVCPDNGLCYSQSELVTMNGTTGAATERFLMNLPQGSTAVATAGSDGRILLTWMLPDGSLFDALLDSTGSVVVSPVQIASEPLSPFNHVSVGWDGHEFLIAVTTNRLQAYRVSATGQLIDTTPIDLGAPSFDPPLFATGAAGQLVVWDASPATHLHIYGRAARTFDDFASATTHLLTESAAMQMQPRLASGRTPYAIWLEGNETPVMNGSVVGGKVSVLATNTTYAAVARGRDSYLVAWERPHDATTFDVVGRRIALDGTPIDANPLLIAGEQAVWYVNTGVAVGSNGTDFLVVFNRQEGFSGVRISPDGKALDPQPITIGRIRYPAATDSPHIVWTGSRYLIAWLDVIPYIGGISPPPPPTVRIRLASISAAGKVLDTGETPQIGPTTTDSRIALAASGKGALLLYTLPTFSPSQACLFTIPISNDGTPGASRQIACEAAGFPPPFASPDLAWDGTEYVGVWGDAAAVNVEATRFDVAGAPIDDAPFVVSPSGFRAAQPAVAASANGVTIAYVRLTDNIPYGGVARIFARTLERIGSIGRGRVAR